MALILSFDYFLILHCTRRHPSLRRLMAVGMLAKLAAAGLYVTMVVRVYDYSADMSHYFYSAQDIDDDLRADGHSDQTGSALGYQFSVISGAVHFCGNRHLVAGGDGDFCLDVVLGGVLYIPGLLHWVSRCDAFRPVGHLSISAAKLRFLDGKH